MNIILPEELVKLDRLPEDPEGMDMYGFQGPEAAGIVKVWTENLCGEIFDRESIINGIRSCMEKNQGLIEVEKGNTGKGLPFYYSLLKNGLEPSGVAYILFLRIHDGDTDYVVQSQFDEMGMTGARDAAVFAYARQEGMVGENLEGWAKDPYDENVTEGMLMNLSEQRAIDEAFPNHPLSVIRQLADFIIGNN